MRYNQYTYKPLYIIARSIAIVITMIFCSNASAQLAGAERMKTYKAPGTSTANVRLAGVKEGTYYIRVKETGKYLGVEGVNPNNGAKVIQWDFKDQDNHKFIIKPSNEQGYFTIMAKHSGRYLNVEGQFTTDGAKIIQWDFVNQDNLKFYPERDFSSEGIVIVGKQSDKALQIAGSTDASNGLPLVLTGDHKAQHFLLEDARGVLQLSKEMQTKVAVNTPLILNQPGGIPVKRTLESSVAYVKNKGNDSRITRQNGGDGTTMQKTARLSGLNKTDMNVISNGNLILNYSPGLIYDVRDLYSGNVLNKEKFKFAENRNPVKLISTVANYTGTNNSIKEQVNEPTTETLRQALVNFNSRYTTAADLTSVQNMQFYASDIYNKTEFGFKVGAQAHYLVADVSSSFEIKNSTETRSIFIDCVKELYTVTAEPLQQGFFQQAPTEPFGNLGFISSVTYGVRIIGIVQMENTDESMSIAAEAGVNFGFAGARVNMGTWSSKASKKTQVKLYVVGGRSIDVGTCTIDNIFSTINEILRNVNYRVAQPIKIQGSTLDGKLINFQDATDNYNYNEFTPSSVANAPTNALIEMTTVEAKTDDDLTAVYGKVWVMAYDAQGREIPAERGDNHLFDWGANSIDMENVSNSVMTINKIVTIPFPKGAANGGYLDMYFFIIEKDAATDWGEGDDDLFIFRDMSGGNKRLQSWPGSPRPRFAILKIPLNNISQKTMYNEVMRIDGDEIMVRFNVTKIAKTE